MKSGIYQSFYLCLALLFFFTSCVDVKMNSQRLNDTDWGAKKVFIEASTIDTDDTYLSNIVAELTSQLSQQGWIIESYVYQIKSDKDSPLDIEKEIAVYAPDFKFDIFISDQLTQSEMISNTGVSYASGTGTNIKTRTSANIQLDLTNYSNDTMVWEGNLTVSLPNGYVKSKLKSGSTVSLAVNKIIGAMKEDGVIADN